MGWAKREAVSNLTILGDDPEKNVKKAGGLLASVKKDSVYENFNYELVQRDGTSIILAGSASINRMIHESDVGRFVKAEFKGWGKSPNGRFKEIDVQVWEDEPTAEMRKWPRWEELNNGNGKPPAAEYDGGGPDDDDDDLPF